MRDKITIYDFFKLSEEEQYDLVFHHGTYLDFRLAGDKRYVLYSVNMFFVEIKYSVNDNKVIGKQPFITGELLDKYSSQKLI